eukprot:SAG31_NODE_942_length_10853_cov_24.620420_5_plen_81_part_00
MCIAILMSSSVTHNRCSAGAVCESTSRRAPRKRSNKRASTKVEQSSLLINSLIRSLAPRAAAGAELESYLYAKLLIHISN